MKRKGPAPPKTKKPEAILGKESVIDQNEWEAKGVFHIAQQGKIGPALASDQIDLPDRAAIQTIAGVVSAIAYVFAVSTGANVVIAGVVIAGLFVPNLFPDNSFKELSTKIIGLIKHEISEHVMATADAAVRANMKECDLITRDFEIWKNANDSDEEERKLQRLQHNYIRLTTEYMPNLIRDFTAPDTAGVVLAQYVISAARYLILLRMFFSYADELDLATRRTKSELKSGSDPDGIQSSSMSDSQYEILQLLRREIAEVTDEAIRLYKMRQQVILKGGDQGTHTWNDFNRYRTLITTTALDLLPALPFLDPLFYPNGCHQQSLNRKLVTLLDTDRERSAGHRYDIAAADGEFYWVRAVMALRQIRLHSGHFFSHQSYDVINGLFATQCVMNSIDGYDYRHSPAITGEKNPDNVGTKPRQDKYIGVDCFGVTGVYWNRTRPVLGPDGQLPFHRMVKSIASITFLHEAPDEQIRRDSAVFTQVPIHGDDFNRFNHGIRFDTESEPVLDPGEQDRIVELDVFVTGYIHTYALAWRHQHALQGMLPLQTHVATDKNLVEQFHAIKAGRDINVGRLKIIKGPGFTGGDLVAVAARQGLNFYLARDPQRWFSGLYKVRLYFVNNVQVGQLANFVVQIKPDGNFVLSSLTGSYISDAIPDINSLKFNDLRLFTFVGTVLLTEAMSGFTLTFGNTSLSGEIIVDRIELIFQQIASMDDVVA